MNAIVQSEAQFPALQIDEAELMGVLRTSLYPGAADQSIKMVISYCKAAQLDPLKKPVHIVPMWDSKAKQMRDVIMPGIGLYRTDAARTGQYAGVSEPEFGPDITEKIGSATLTFPAWCKVTVKRKIGCDLFEYTAKEYWRENYATKGKDDLTPNAMWFKRPYGQIAKCAEAQALRKGFPEACNAPTADEMEGKEIYERDITPIKAVEVPKNPMALEQKEKELLPALNLDELLNDISWINSAEELGKKWKEVAGLCAKHNSEEAKIVYTEFKAAVAKRGDEIKRIEAEKEAALIAQGEDLAE